MPCAEMRVGDRFQVSGSRVGKARGRQPNIESGSPKGKTQVGRFEGGAVIEGEKNRANAE